MHLEIVVEDQSGKKALEEIVPKVVDESHTFRIIAYKGVGRIPKSIRDPKDASKRHLMENLPKLLKGYGKTFAGYGASYRAAVIVVRDLDDGCLKELRQTLFGILNQCNRQPETRFCIAIEEGEAWLLGDLSAVRAAYPRAKESVLNSYQNDSICGTWETLADAIYPDGAKALARKPWKVIGEEKSKWAEAIAPHMDVENNDSPSFCYFRDKIRSLLEED